MLTPYEGRPHSVHWDMKERYHMGEGLAGAPFLVRCFIQNISGSQAIGPWAVVF